MNRLKPVLSILLVCVMALAVVLFFRSRWDQVRDVQLAHPMYLVGVLAAYVATVYLRGLFTLSVLRAFDVRMAHGEAFALSAVGTLFNTVLPVRTGAGVRGAYLFRYHDLPVHRFLSSMAAFAAFNIFIASVLGLISFVIVADATDPRVATLCGMLVALAAAMAWIIFRAPQFPALPWRIVRYIEQVGRGWDTIRHHPGALRTALLTSALLPLFGTIGFYAGFRAFGIEIDLVGALLITAAYALSGVIAITPGALGVQELVGIYFGGVLGMALVETLSILLAIRLVRVAAVSLVGLPAMVYMRRHAESFKDSSPGEPASNSDTR